MADLLMDALAAEAVIGLTERLDAPADHTAAGVRVALPVLLGALARNAASVRGARSLHAALMRDHDGRILEAYGAKVAGLDLEAGEAVLWHVFGANAGRVSVNLAERSGLSEAQVESLLELLAPLVLGAVGRRMRERKLGASGLRREMRKEERGMYEQQPALRALVDGALGGVGVDGHGRPPSGCLR